MAGMLLYKAADVLRECFTRLLSFGIVVPIRLSREGDGDGDGNGRSKKESEKKYSIQQHQKKIQFSRVHKSNKMCVCTKVTMYIFMEDVEYICIYAGMSPYFLYECVFVFFYRVFPSRSSEMMMTMTAKGDLCDS